MSIEDFVKTAKVENYEDDLSPHIYFEGQSLKEDEIVHNLPKKYSHVTEEQLKELPALRDSLESALNAASEDALIDACYDEQNKALENYADELVELVNKIPDSSTDKALNSIVIDWKADEVLIDFNVSTALAITREIINGEGMFEYNSDKEFAEIGDGSYKPKETVISHLHYLLDGKLINSIFGFSTRRFGKLEWECSYGDVTDDHTVTRIEEHLNPTELQFLQGKASFNLIKALELKELQSSRDDLAMDTTKKLVSHIGTLSQKDKIAYEHLVRKD